MQNTKLYDIISIGDCVVDSLYYVDPSKYNKESNEAEIQSVTSSFGGKGANSCICSARLGSKTTLIAKIGNDSLGKSYIQHLKSEGINTEYVKTTNQAPTSTASIFGDSNGVILKQKCMFGASSELNINDLDTAENLIQSSNCLITTLVLKPEVSLHSLKLAKKHKSSRIKHLDPEFSVYKDILVVNQVEAEVLTKNPVNSIEEAMAACEKILSSSTNGYSIGVIVTLGSNGCILGEKKLQNRFIKHFTAMKVKAVDTIGAGDAFLGALAHYLNKFGFNQMNISNSLEKAILLAIEYSSLSVEQKGAQSSYLYLHQLSAKFY